MINRTTPQTIALLLVLGVGGRSFSAAPVIFHASDPIGPDETAVIAGANLDRVRTVRLRRLDDDAKRKTASARTVEVKVIQSDAHALMFVIPSTMGAGVYSYDLLGPDGASTGVLNAPTVYWTQGDRGHAASPGGWLRVLGRNIARTARATLELIAADGSVLQLHPQSASLWDGAFTIPTKMPAGTYRLRIWNGHGDAETWRDGGTLEIGPRTARPAVLIDVRAAGAIGDGAHDDSRAIDGALRAAGARGGGTVYFPRGYYRLSTPLNIPGGVAMKGEARDVVTLVWSDFKDPPNALLSGYSNFAIENITIVATNHAHLISGGFSDNGGSDGQDIAIRHVTVRASIFGGHQLPEVSAARARRAMSFSSGGADTLRLAGHNLIVEDCDLSGSGRSLFLFRPRSAHIAGNTFYNGRVGWYSVTGADGVIFENNHVVGADLQSTGGGINTLSPESAASRNILFYKNTFDRFFGWDREALTSDGAGGFYFGNAQAIDAATLRLIDSPAQGAGNRTWIGAGVFVIGGRGLGEFAEVRKIEADRVFLDHPLPALPDSSSVFSIVSMQENYLIIENEFHDAGVAVQFFGTSVNHVVFGNKSHRTSGYADRGIFYHHPQPSWYTQILANEIVNGDLSAPAAISICGSQAGKTTALLNFGAIVRANVLDGNARIDVGGSESRDTPSVSDLVIEKNKIRNTDVAIAIDGTIPSLVIRNNTMDRVKSGVVAGYDANRCRNH
jgi:hypothetical protein